jgi:hypothetical protein
LGKRNRYRAGAWRTLLKDRMPAYISWERYEANQKRLENNRSITSAIGAPRVGAALLSGLVVCGNCGRRFNTQYPSGGRGYYLCTRHLQKIEPQTCRGLAARAVDRLVSAQVLAALQPAALALSLRAIADEQKERGRLEEHWQQKLERARYTAGRAERQYHAVEPENRLVARTLEKQWEDALLELRRLEEEFDRFASAKPVRLTGAERARIVALSADVSTLWEAPGTTHADRKEIIRCLVERVVVRVQQNTERCAVAIHWNGGHTTHHTMARPVRSQRQLRDESSLRERVIALHRENMSAAEIATILNTEGYSPPRRETYGADQVRWLFRYYGLRAAPPGDELKPEEWWLTDLATELKVPVRKLRDWAMRKWCRARQRARDQRWIVRADAEEVQRLRRLAKQSKLGQVRYPSELTTPSRKKRG